VRSAAQLLQSLDEVSAVQWRVDNVIDDQRASVSMWVWSDGDALRAFAQIVALVPDGWENQDDDLFIGSRWTASDSTAPFLSEGVLTASVTYRRWASPVRRSRTEIE
jgi:hypothetical protein